MLRQARYVSRGPLSSSRGRERLQSEAMVFCKSLMAPFRALFSCVAKEKDSVWSELPDDVLGLILRMLSPQDYLRCRAVCGSWRRVAQKPHSHPPAIDLLWLMSSELEDAEATSVFSLSKGITCTIKLPEFRKSRCCGSSQGWLVMVSIKPDYFPKNFLLNPFSAAKIQLPSQTEIPSPIKCFKISKKNLYFVKKAVLSSAPTLDDIAAGNCMVVGIVQCDDSSNLAFCRPGDQKWSLFEVEPETNYNLYKDIVYCNRQFYALDFGGKLTVCEFGLHPKTIRLDLPPPFQISNIKRNEFRCLAEFSGELFLVLRNRRLGKMEFQIFKFDASAIRWVEDEEIDDCALVFSKNSVILFPASQFQRHVFFLRNCTMRYLLKASKLIYVASRNSDIMIQLCFA